MPFISQITPQIKDILKHWNEIIFFENQKKTIDHLIPIIQTASIINFLQPDPYLKKELDDFKKIFAMLFRRELDHVGDYRFENARLERIKDIELKKILSVPVRHLPSDLDAIFSKIQLLLN